MKHINWAKLYHEILEEWKDYQAERLKELGTEYLPVEHQAQAAILSLFCVYNICVLSGNGEPADLRFVSGVLHEESFDCIECIRKNWNEVMRDYRERFEEVTPNQTKCLMGEVIYKHLLKTQTDLIDKDPLMKSDIVFGCDFFFLRLISEYIQLVEQGEYFEEVNEGKNAMNDQQKIEELLLIYKKQYEVFKIFQQKSIAELQISYDSIRHNAHVFMLSAFCTHILLGFEDKFTSLKRAFSQRALEQQEPAVQDYIYQNGERVDITYFKAFKLLLEKKDKFAMGNAIYELLLQCNVDYDPYIDIPTTDVLVMVNAAYTFDDFILRHQDIAIKLREGNN